jgi:DmsA/YnfE family anaerobic dimethyl sulfoxide reductase A subunit
MSDQKNEVLESCECSMLEHLARQGVSRREFMTACSVATVTLAVPAFFRSGAASAAEAAAPGSGEKVVWSSCVVNCGSRCPLKVIVKDNEIIRIEPENTGADSCTTPHVRACVRGRAMRQRVYSDERLKYPLKRVGKRGEGQFVRISWDEAFDTVAAALKKTIANYGNDAIYYQYGSGTYQLVAGRAPNFRLLNLIGGYLDQYGTYSSAQIREGMPYTYGSGGNGSYMTEVANTKLYLSFGNSPLNTRQSGGGKGYEWQCAKDAGQVRTILIDPMYTDSMLGKEDEWIAIRPGTDAALCEGIAYVLITENKVDQAFLDAYCVGYDEKTLPGGAPAKSDYKNYILGNGADKLAKTPGWASQITGIPVSTIVRLAREIGDTKPVFVSQGYGVQRQANGEQSVRAIAMIPILTGNIGLPGTNTGAREGDVELGAVGLPVGKNAVKPVLPFFLWTDAIERGEQMTAMRDGIRGADKLRVPIKFMWNYAGNVLGNQHSDINRTHRILQDESKCEFIVVIDNQMTPSARLADIVLPDLMAQENFDYASDGYASGTGSFLVALQQAVKPRFEEKSSYEICRGIAKRFGLEDKFTEGRSQEEWVEWCYEETRKKHPELPSFRQFQQQGVAKMYNKGKAQIALQGFRKDPQKNRLPTPSGKIEIYSERLAKIAATWELPPGDVISPLPQYVTTWESHLDPIAAKYPLQLYGFHGHGRTHSTYHNVKWLRELHPDMLLINPVDAAKRDLKTGDQVRVFNDRGTVLLAARVSPRIMPGVIAFPQGAWYKPNSASIDEGGCINTLTSQRPSALAKANPQHTNLVQVAKA